MRSCCRYRLAGKPVQALVRFSTNATGRSRPFSIRSLNNTTRISCQRWKCRITTEELGVLGNRISRRVAKFLERWGFLERSGGVPLCRYIARPAVSEKRLSLLEDGRIRYELKTPYRDGTTHVAAPAHPEPAALVRPCTSSSSRWTSWLGLLRWFRNPGSTSPGSTVCLHLTANIGYRSRLPNEERVASATQKRKGNANHRQSGGHQ